MAKQSAADIESYTDAVAVAYPKMRQLAAQRKKVRDSEKTMFAALMQQGITKAQFMEAWKRHEQEEGQLTLFDQMASTCENAMREIVAEQGPKETDDRKEDHEEEKKGRKPQAAKKAKKAAGAKAEPSKPALATNGGKRVSHRAGFVDRNERMSAAEANKLMAKDAEGKLN